MDACRGCGGYTDHFKADPYPDELRIYNTKQNTRLANHNPTIAYNPTRPLLMKSDPDCSQRFFESGFESMRKTMAQPEV